MEKVITAFSWKTKQLAFYGKHELSEFRGQRVLTGKVTGTPAVASAASCTTAET